VSYNKFFNRFLSHPTEVHWIHLKQVLRCIKDIINYKLCYKKAIDTTQVLTVYVDAYWGNDNIKLLNLFTLLFICATIEYMLKSGELQEGEAIGAVPHNIFL